MHAKSKLLRVFATALSLLLLFSSVCFPVSSVSYTTSSNYHSSVYYQRLSDVTLTGDSRVDIVNVALSQYGYCEGGNSWELSGMQEGFYNYTEYGHWYGVQSLWCAMFVSWCAHNAGISQEIVPSHAYTGYGLIWFMDRGQAHSRSSVEAGNYTPQAGDIIYFRSNRNNSIVNHVGIVIGYFDGYVYTVEGNVNFDPTCTDGGQVLVRSRHISDTYIRYICSPDYSSEAAHEVGAFFPAEGTLPVEEALIVPLPSEEIAYVETTHSASETASAKPQYSFIP